jgi:hypothetical protein
MEGDFLGGIGRTESRMIALLRLDAILAFEVAKRERT